MKIVKTVKTNVGSRIIELIQSKKYSNKEILKIVRDEDSNRKTSYACIAWYQSKLKKEALEVDTTSQDEYMKNEIELLNS
jgi:hypothetical protein